MFNSGFRGRRENDGQGSINPQAKYVQTKYPQPYISGWSISGSDDTALNPAGGQTVLVNGSGFATGISATLGGSQIGSVTLVNPTQISFTAPANSGGSYTLIVYNSTGGAAILVPGLTYSSVPTWTTAAGSIGSYYETTAINSNVVATSDSALTYTLSSGSLPSGATLYANGVITGTAPVDSGSTTYTFNITATDAELQDTTRTFTMTINVDVVTWVAPTNGTTYTVPSNVAISNVSLSATDAAGYGIVYSANSLPTGVSITGNVITGTPTVGANTSTLLTATANTTGRTATNTINWVVQLGDSYWNLTTLALNSLPTTTPFQSDASLNNASITPVGDTKSSPYSPYQTGYYSNYFDGSGDYLSIPSNAAFNLSGIDWTIETWVYATVLNSINFIFQTDGSNNTGLCLGINSAGTPYVYAGGFYYGTVGAITVNNWYHVAWVRSSSTLKIYVNGVGSNSQAFSVATNYATPRIGQNSSAAENYTGYLSNFRVIKGIPLYTTTFTPSTTPLVTVAGTSLLTCQSQRLIDTSPNNFAITKNGDTKAVPANPFATQYDYGTTYYSTYFDGSGDYLSVPDSSTFLITGDVTVEAWVYQISSKTVTVIAQWPISGIGSFLFRIDSTAKLSFAYDLGSGGVNSTASTSTITYNTWNHVAWVRSGTTFKYFINGVQDATTNTVSGSFADSAGAVLVGLYNTGVDTYFNGCISNLRFVKGQALYTANFTPSTSPLTTTSQGATAGNVSLLTCQSSTLIDNSTNAFAITSNGDARPVPQSPFYSAYYSNYFDGSGDYLSLGSNAAFAFGTGDFTVECWVNYTNKTNSGIFQIGATLFPAVNGIGLGLDNGPNWMLYYGNGSQTAAVTGPTNGVWYHVAVVRSSSVTKVYINGSSTISTADSTNYTGSTLGIAGIYSTSYVMNGYISNFRVTKGQALYTSTFTPSTSPLTTTSQGATAGNVSLLTCQSLYFIDNSTNVFAITVNGNTTVATLAPFTQPSQYGATTAVATYGSAYFDGSGDYLTCGTNQAYAVGTGNFTVEAWVYMTSRAAEYNIISTRGSGGSANAWSLSIVTTGGVTVFTDAYVFNGVGTVPLNAWTHIALVREGTSTNQTKLYVNGSIVATTTNSQNFTSGTLAIGASNDGSQFPFLGYISNARLVKGTAVYTANFLPSPTPLTAVTNTQLLTLQYNGGSNDSQFRDGSNFQNLITRNGNTTQGTFSPFSATGWSGYFDGNGDYLSIPNQAAVRLGAGDFTVEAWIFPNSVTNTYTRAICGTYGYVGTADRGWTFNINTSSKLSIYLGGSADPGVTLASTTSIVANVWTHVVACRSGTTLRLFINGVQDASTTTSKDENYTGVDFNIATYRSDNLSPATGNSGTSFVGNISNLRIVIGSALYTSNFTPSTTPLTAVSKTTLLTLQSPAFVDNSASRLTITSNGDSKTQSFSPFSGVTTTQYYSNYFDGTGDYLTVSSTANAAFGFGTGNFTVEGWFYATADNATDFMIDFRGGVATAPAIFLYTSNQLALYYNGSIVYQPSSLTFITGQWNHVALVRSSNVTKFYLNGVGASTTYTDNNNYPSAACIIGSDVAAGGSSYWTGYISNLRITKGQALYTTNFTPATSPLTTTSQGATAANVSLLTCQSSTFIDNSTNAFAITVNGDAIPTTVAPFAATSTTLVSYTTSVNGGSAYFDGTGDYVLTASTPALGTSDWTAECWFYPTALAGYGQVMGMRMNVSSGPNQYVPIYIQYGTGTGTFLFLSSTTGSSWNITSGSSFGTCTTGQWFHIAVCRSGSSIYGFLNGVKKFTVNISTNSYSSTNPWHVGGNSGGDNSIGYISNCRYVIGTAIYTSAFSPPTAPPVPTAATVVLLNSTNGSIIDYTGKNDLETVGDARLAPQNPYGGSYYSNYFDGTGDYLNLAANAAFGFGTGDFTVEFWLYLTASPSSGSKYTLVDFRTSANHTMYVANSAGTLYLGFYNGSTDTTTNSQPLTVSSWYHCAWSRGSGTLKIYVNGAQAYSAANSVNYLSTGSPYIGASSSGGIEALNGYISNLRITKGQALYTTTFTPATSPLTTTSQSATAANVSLLTCQSSTFKDNSTNAFTVTRNGDTAVNSINPFQNNGTYSMYFDGTGDYLVAPNSPGFAFGTGDFTVECWVYCTTFGANGFLVLDSRPSGSAAPYTMGVTVTGLPYIYDGSTITSGSSGITLNSWAYLTWCRSSSTLKMFVNGVSVYSASYTSSITGTGSLTIGGLVAGGAGYFLNGYMTDLRITKYARYTTAFTPPTSTFQTK